MSNQAVESETGSVTAEFVAAMPAVLLILMACLAALGAVCIQIRLSDAAAVAARSLARGDSSEVAARIVGEIFPGAHLREDARAGLVCANVSAPMGNAVLEGVTLEAGSCALGQVDDTY